MQEKFRNEKTSEMIVEKISSFSEDKLNSLIELEEKCFPEEMRYSYEYYKDLLSEDDNLNLFLLDKSNCVVGHLLALPIEKIFDEVLPYDSYVKNDTGFFYLDAIQIHPNFRGKGGLERLLDEMLKYARQHNYDKFSVHARVTNHFNEKLKNIFKDKLIKERKISRWHFGNNEPYSYLAFRI